ncbi:MAG: S53 family peptidase [Acidimicrobiales bacterium]
MRIRPTVTALVCAGTVTGFLAVGTPGASASVSWANTGTHALKLAHATPLGKVPANTRLTVRVAMSLRNQRGLKSFIANANNPSMATYRHYLTPSQFVARYGPTTASVTSVEHYLTAHGFKSISVTSNRLLVSATGTVGDAERAFDTSISYFRQFGAKVYANTTVAKVPSTLRGRVLSVLGLNDVIAFHMPLAHVTKTGPLAGSGLPKYAVSYNPSQFPKIYGATSATPTGAKTSIAIITEGNLAPVIKDLRIAETKNHLPKVPVTIVHAGVASPDTSGAIEWNMDTQSSTGMAGNVKRLYLYDATSLTDSDLALAINRFAAADAARGGSASLGECETFPYLDGSMLADDEAFAEAAAQGQSFFASSGDTGASCAVAPTNGVPGSGPPNANYPASSPYVTAVGGTTLLTNSNGTYNNEIAWNAGGGGSSVWETAPFWQAGVVPGSAAGKGVPDIAMDADPSSGVTLYVNGTQQQGWGGTSLSSPLALGVWARLESGHGNNLGMASPALYHTYLAGKCTTTPVEAVCATPALHDIIVGTNGAFVATPGWDYTTGLGSFDIQQMEQLIK